MNFPTLDLNDIVNQPKSIISVYGDFGVGKTTFALQTAINTAKSGKNILYIYSKPTFPFKKVGNLLKEDSEQILDNIIFMKITNFTDLFNYIFKLEFLLLDCEKIKNKSLNLIVVDSLTELYKIELDYMRKEKNFNLSYQLNQILANLSYISQKYNVEILIVNDVSRKNINNQIIEAQGGGRVMDYWIKELSIKIKRTEILNKRLIIVKKHFKNKRFEFSFDLTKYGFEKT